MTRNSKETQIEISLNLDGTGEYDIHTGSGFLDHMLELFARHGRFDLSIKCVGDTHIDYHHTTEDIAMVLGDAFQTALGDRKGICRYGEISIPMDEAMVMAVVDLSGRSYVVNNLQIPTEKVGNFDTELINEFMVAFSRKSKSNIHFYQFAGTNSHHIIEAAFKALARSLRKAVSIDEEFKDEIPSTKGILDI